MILKELVLSGNAQVPKSIRGKPLSDFSIQVGVFRGDYSVIARSGSIKVELAVFDDNDSATAFKDKLIAAGAKAAGGGDW